MKTIMKGLLSILFAGGVVGGSLPARAAHTGLSHGDLCSSGSNSILFDDGGATNTSTTQHADFYCPVINADPTDMTAATGRVRGWDGDSGFGAFICNGIMRNSSSQVVMFTGDAQGPLTTGYTGAVNIPNPGNGTITFSTTVTSADSLEIYCQVPPRSTIYNVRIDQ
jgi:hypothetical protein